MDGIQASRAVEDTFMSNMQSQMNQAEEQLMYMKNRLADAGFHVRNDEPEKALPVPNDTAKDILRNTMERVVKLCADLRDQIGQVC